MSMTEVVLYQNKISGSVAMKVIHVVVLAILLVVGKVRSRGVAHSVDYANDVTVFTIDTDLLQRGKDGLTKNSAAEEVMMKMEKAFTSCQAKHPLVDAEVEAMKNMETDYDFSHDAKCFFACMFKAGDMLKGGKFMKETVLHLADVLSGDDLEDSESSRKVIEYCAVEVPEDEPDLCEYVHKMTSCWANEAKKLA